MEKILREFRFAAEDNDSVNVIVNDLAELAAASAYKQFGNAGLIEEVVLNNYNEQNEKVKTAALAFAAKKAGIDMPQTATDMAYAMDNEVFANILNTINTRAIGVMLGRYTSPMLDNIASIETVGVGESRSFEIDTKALPIAQRATYGSNVSMVPSYAMGSITVAPKPYTLGISLDYIRIIANGYDYGRAVARIYAGMLFAQYQLIVNKLFDTSILNGTPLYQPNFAASTYVQMADDIAMLNGSTVDSVTAFGTRVAWQAINALATQGGFTTRDEYIKAGYLQKIFGVNSMILEQFSNNAAPFTTANAPALRAIPNDLIVLVSEGADKVVKLVREDYVRVIETPAKDNTLNRNEYTYFLHFDAKIATASYFGLQGTSQG